MKYSLLICLVLTGCANFSTKQVDRSYEEGKLVREIITQASATTVIESKSELAKFKATQTDKSQSASVGALNQDTAATNAISDAALFLGTLIKAAK